MVALATVGQLIYVAYLCVIYLDDILAALFFLFNVLLNGTVGWIAGVLVGILLSILLGLPCASMELLCNVLGWLCSLLWVSTVCLR